ncbi:MAG: hypothetical protein HQK76_13495 [Desulfobacterales bacterium]|nr:hypothetical protein [Desulfobacterales bacterium]
MSEKARIIDFEHSNDYQKNQMIKFDSGRQISILSEEKEELIEIIDTKGEIVLKLRMTDDGPVISMQGARLELKAMETISLETKKLKIHAEEKAVISSNGCLEIDSSKSIDMHSDDDIRVNGKMIYLN